MRILSLDISTKTGYCVLDLKEDGGFDLVTAGTAKKISNGKSGYPQDYFQWSLDCFNEIENLYDEHKPHLLVIEETSKGSKNHLSQKLLEWIHFRVVEFMIGNKIEHHYFQVGTWRNICGCKMSSKESKQNKSVRTQHSKGTKVVKGEDGKRIGKITKKHVNVRRANEIFDLDLKLKNEDQADAMLLAYAYYLEIFQVSWYNRTKRNLK